MASTNILHLQSLHRVVATMSNVEGCPVKHDLPSSSASNDACPVKGEKALASSNEVGYNPAANDLSFNQHRQPDQVRDMSTVRAVSGIEKSTYTPGHQFANVDKWVYPSGQSIKLKRTMKLI